MIDGSSNESVTASFLSLGLGEATARAIAFATTLLIARRLGADGLGAVSFAFAVLLYLQRFVDAGIDLGIGVREVASGKKHLNDLVGAVLTMRLAIALVMTALAFAAAAALPSLEGSMVRLYALTLVPLALGTRWVLTGLGATRPVGVSRAIGELVVLALVAAVVLSAGDLWRVPVAQLAGDTIATALLLIAVTRAGITIRLGWNPDVIRPLVRHVAPYVASALLGLVIFNSDLLFLRAFRDRATVGLYASAYALVSFLINVGATYALSLISPLTRLAEDPTRRQALYETSWARAVAIVLPIVVGGGMIASELLDLVVGPEFRSAGTALAILLVSVPLSVLRSLAITALTAQGREDLLFRTVLVAAAFNLVLNLIAVPLFGIVGAAIVTVATELLRLVLAQRYAAALNVQAPAPRRYWKAGLAAGLMAGVLALDLARSVVPSVALGAVAYGLALLVLGGIGRGRDGRLQLTV